MRELNSWKQAALHIPHMKTMPHAHSFTAFNVTFTRHLGPFMHMNHITARAHFLWNIPYKIHQFSQWWLNSIQGWICYFQRETRVWVRANFTHILLRNTCIYHRKNGFLSTFFFSFKWALKAHWKLLTFLKWTF